MNKGFACESGGQNLDKEQVHQPSCQALCFKERE